MCSRFALFRSKQEILDELTPLLWTDDYRPNWNVAPTTPMPVAITSEAEKRIETMGWGVQPAWSRQPLVNVRSESMRSKPTFRPMVEACRFALVPMDAYFEWRRDGAKRVPFMIRKKDQRLLCAAALWDESPEGLRFVIITRDAVGGLATVHDRMPVFVDWGLSDDWLRNGELSVDALPNLEMIQVHPRINSVRTHGPSAIEIMPTQSELF